MLLGSHLDLNQADVVQTLTIAPTLLVVAILQPPVMTATLSVSWLPFESDRSPPASHPPEPCLGRAPPLLA